MDFDHSEWQQLARTNPEEFERRRIALIEEVIASAPPDIQRRLRGLQFKVDAERGRASNPLSATIRISRMMWGSFAELREQLNQLSSGNYSAPTPAVKSEAKIIPLKKPAME